MICRSRVVAGLLLFVFLISGLSSFVAPASANSIDTIISHPSAYEWPMFLHDAQHLGSVVSPSPHSNHLLGSSLFRGPIASSVASSDDALFFGSGSTFYAVNESTLTKLWTHSTGGAISSSPAVSSGNVYFGSSDGSVYALSVVDGSRTWGLPTGGAVHSSPSIVGGVLYVGSDNGTLFAASAGTGNKVWHYSTAGPVRSSPAVSNGLVAFGSNDGKVYFVSVSTGKLVFSYTTAGAVESSPAFWGTTAIVGSNDTFVYGINSATHGLLWSYKTGGRVTASPMVSPDGVVYVGSLDGFLYALNATNGNKIWKTSIGATSSSGAFGYAAGNDFGSRKSQSVPGVPTVYTSNQAGTIFAVYAGNGSIRWTFSTGSSNQASPALVYTKIYMGVSSGNLYQLGELPQSGAVASFTSTGILQKSFLPGTSIILGINEAWGKFGMHSTVLVSVFNPSGVEILINASMTFFPGGNSQYNFYYHWQIPSTATPGKYKITVLSEDANPKFGSNHPRCCGYVLFRGQFTVQ